MAGPVVLGRILERPRLFVIFSAILTQRLDSVRASPCVEPDVRKAHTGGVDAVHDLVSRN